jgi:uncharacterized protein YjbI with pentapeptide repeats
VSALIQLGLGHLAPEQSAVSVGAQNWLERFKTVDEWLKRVFEGIEKLPKDFKDSGEVGKILEKAAPWIEAGSKAFPPAHLLFEVASALTKINEPQALAILACTVAYQSTAEKAIREAGLPEGRSVARRLRDSIGVTRDEFAYFTIEGSLTHPFIRAADEVLEFYAARAGYDERQIEKLIATIHDRFRPELRLIITRGENQEKFAPLRNWLGTDAKEALVREALRRHVQYISWLFEEAPLLDEEPYALKHIYIDTGCGVLTRKQLCGTKKDGRPSCDPFKRDEENGGVHSLVETVLGYIRNPQFNDVIIIQGSAGTGKSSFTRHLAATLARDGLTPLLVRLRDAENISQGLFRTVGDALRYEDQDYLRGSQEPFQSPAEVLGNGTLFNESVPYHGAPMCPYVLILDGWDEISLDVSVGYKQKVQALLSEIRQEFFRGRHARVRVILTGRPSDAVDSAENFFHDTTPVLTVRQMTPEQLEQFAEKVRYCVSDRPLRRYSSNWEMPAHEKLKPLFDKYTAGFGKESGQLSEQVLGVPFLAQLAFRVIANPGSDGDLVATDATALLRRITDITIHHARLSSEQIRVGGSLGGSERKTGKTLHGDPLRRLLHKTAAKMTIVGRESVSHKELWDYLQAGNDEKLIEQTERAGGVTGLLIAFFFKGGNTDLGCEFTHKALREYLFAEAVVECIKQLARHFPTTPDLPVRAHYWRDFVDDDPQREWSRNLAELMAPQWLTWPVKKHILSLLEWEIGRATATTDCEGATQALTPAEWIYVRDGMADVYDWWAEGVPLRPQLAVATKKNETEWSPPYFQILIEEQFERPARPDILSVTPPRLTTYDGHLGAALMESSAAIHYEVRELISRTGLQNVLRPGSRVQSQNGNEPVQFRPGGTHSEYFIWYCDRVNAAGWYRPRRQRSRFPFGAVLRCADLSGADLDNANLRGADLRGASLDGADLYGADLYGANLRGANFNEAKLNDANLGSAGLSGALLSGANLSGADLSQAILNDADLTAADLAGVNLTGAGLAGADLTGADLTDADLTDADLTAAFLGGAVLARAKLSGAKLSGAKFDSANCDGADFTGAYFRSADLADVELTNVRLAHALDGVHWLEAPIDSASEAANDLSSGRDE